MYKNDMLSLILIKNKKMIADHGTTHLKCSKKKDVSTSNLIPVTMFFNLKVKAIFT
jgi:hypothetical protein